MGKPLIAPVTLPSGADVQFNGSKAVDRLTLDRSWSGFTGSLTFNGNGGNDQLDAHTVSLKEGCGTDTLKGVRTRLTKDTTSDSTKVIDTSFIFDFDALLASLM